MIIQTIQINKLRKKSFIYFIKASVLNYLNCVNYLNYLSYLNIPNKSNNSIRIVSKRNISNYLIFFVSWIMQITPTIQLTQIIQVGSFYKGSIWQPFGGEWSSVPLVVSGFRALWRCVVSGCFFVGGWLRALWLVGSRC